MDVDTPVLDVDGMGFGEPYVAVDATAGVPTGVGLVGVVDTHCHHVLTFVNVGGNVVLEAGVAIRAGAYLLAVYEYRRIHVDSVELQEGFLAACRQRENLPVPADATGEGTAGGAAGVAIVEIALDGPVVRNIESAPMGIVILRTGHLGRVAQDELPVVIKTNSLSGL